MGYAQSGLRDGTKVIAPQFANVTNTLQYNLTDLIPQGPDIYNNVTVTRISSTGGLAGRYTWTDAGGEGYDTPDVWVDQDNNIVTDVKLEKGEALWVDATKATQFLRSSGQVETKDLVSTLKDGTVCVGNAFPVQVKINDLIPGGDDIYNNVSVTIVSATGGIEGRYTWTDAGGEGYDVPDVWVDQDNNICPNSVVLEPGEGLWVDATSNKQTLTFPAPEIH